VSQSCLALEYLGRNLLIMQIEVEGEQPERLDLFLGKKLPEISRSKIQNLIKKQLVTVNQQVSKPKTQVLAGDVINIKFPEEVSELPQPECIPLEVLFEDESIIILNKESGMVVHPAAGNHAGTLVNALLHHCKGQLAAEGGVDRPGIVHRLDKDTSGCIVVAKTDQAHRHLVEQFATRTTEKEYLAVVNGMPLKKEDKVLTNIGRHPVNRLKMAVVSSTSGKEAITDYKVMVTDDEEQSALVHCVIFTGRTHQIRVHMQHVGSPILGDVIYAKPARQNIQTGRLMLHARRLCITHPLSGERVECLAPIPDEFQPWVSKSDAAILRE